MHLAALGSVPRSVADPLASHHANATGTVMVLEAARRHGDLHTDRRQQLAASTARNPILPKHEDLATRPLSPYGGSKLATEGYTLAWGSSYGLPVLAFRFFNVFGPLQPAGHAYAAVIPAFVDAALARRAAHRARRRHPEPRLHLRRHRLRHDHRRPAPHASPATSPVNLAFGSRITLLDTLELLEGILGHPIERNHVENRKGDVPHSQADNTRLRALFPDIEPVPFPDGLRTTVDWMRAEHARQTG